MTRHTARLTSLVSSARTSSLPLRLLAAGVSGLVLFAAGVATAVYAQAPGSRTYSTKGKVTTLQGTKLVIKDKFGVDWEYALPKGLTTAVGKDVKVVYVMQAVKIEAP